MRALWAIPLIVLVASATAWAADARVTFFTKQLGTATDPRARSQAAIALGMYGEPAAVPALCDALSDDHEVVRVAAARALDSIADISAIACLEKAAGDAGSGNQAVATALQSLNALKALKPRLYVLLAPLDNRAGLTDEEVALLTERLKGKLVRYGAIFALAGEGRAAANEFLAETNLEGVMLVPTVEKVGAGLGLTVVVLSYPEKKVQAQFSVKASGGRIPDQIRALVPIVVDDCADEFGWGAPSPRKLPATSAETTPPRSAMETALLYAHSWWRSILFAVGVIAIGRALKTLRTNRAWTNADRRMHRAFVIALDLQFVLGVALWLASPNSQVDEHMLFALMAVTVVHLLSARAKRAEDPIWCGKLWACAAVSGFVLLLAAMAWPLLGDGWLFRLP